MNPIFLTLAAIILVLTIYLAVRSRIEENDLKRQISEHDENSYS